MSMFETLRSRPVRFALVGCGRISANHVQAISALGGDAELVDVCDTDLATARRVGDATGARAHDSLERMLEQSSADVVALCTPSGLHSLQGIKVAASGRHVVSEKPMATRWRDGVALVDACDKAGVQLFVVKQNRFNPPLMALKAAIDAGRFGRIHLVQLNVFWTRPQAYYDTAPWRGTWELDGGAFMNQASHYVDLATWLCGPLDNVFAYTATRGRRIETEDTGVAALRWRSGAVGSINVTVLTYPKNLEGSVTVMGENGTVRVGGVAVNKMLEWNFAEPMPQDAAIAQNSYETESVYGTGHQMYYRNVLEVLRGNAQATTSGREGLLSLQTLVALYRSARDGTSIGLPLDL